MEYIDCVLSLNWSRLFKKITVFTDASPGNINNGVGTYSTGAQISWMIDGKSNCCPIAWQANKVKLVVRSTIAAECLSS